jgi:hypothetical protein
VKILKIGASLNIFLVPLEAWLNSSHDNFDKSQAGILADRQRLA